MDSLTDLYRVIQQRITQGDPAQSYTARLYHAGLDRILQKVGEEAIEVLLAAKGQGRQRLIEEVADLTYHVLVLLAARGITLEDILNELRARERHTRTQAQQAAHKGT